MLLTHFSVISTWSSAYVQNLKAFAALYYQNPGVVFSHLNSIQTSHKTISTFYIGKGGDISGRMTAPRTSLDSLTVVVFKLFWSVFMDKH